MAEARFYNEGKGLLFWNLDTILQRDSEERTVQHLARCIRSNLILEDVIIHSLNEESINGSVLLDAVFQNQNVKSLAFKHTNMDLRDICRPLRKMSGLKCLDWNV